MLFEVRCPTHQIQPRDGIKTYKALLKQVLVAHARRLAQKYPQPVRQQYTEAAERLRSPFWDWATDTAVPASTVPEKLTINTFDGAVTAVKEVRNPLYTYVFPRAVIDGEYGVLDAKNRSRTLRCPYPQRYPGSANDLLRQRPYRQWVVSGPRGGVMLSG